MPSLLDEARAIVHAAENAPSAVEDAGKALERVTQILTENAAHSIMAGADIADYNAVTRIAAGSARWFNFGAMLPLITVDLWLTFINRKWIDATKRLPGPFSKLGNVLTFALFPFHGLVDRYINQLWEWSHSLYPDVTNVFHYTDEQKLINLAGPTPKSPPTHHAHPPTVNTSPLQHEIDRLQREINTLAYTVGIEQHKGNVPRTVYDQIHTLQLEMSRVHSTFTDVYTRLNEDTARLTSLEHELDKLTVVATGLRTVTAGWQDIASAQQQEITRLTRLYDRAEAQIHRHTSQLTALAPLALLLSAGPKGLKTLRQLEDTPCMCPKFGGIPNELGTALAVIEFIENG